MFTVLSNTRNSNLYLIIALATALVAVLAFAVVPAIPALEPAVIPATGSQNAYVEFLRGEKIMYANPVELRDALSAYRAGEKAIYTKSIDLGNALSAWRFGEQAIYAYADPSPDFSHLKEKKVAPSSYRSPLDDCFDVPLREVAQCRNESEARSQ